MGSEHAGHRHEPLGLSGRALSSGLRSAEARCAAHGQRLTPARRRVLELLMSAGQPVKAYDLISAFGEEAGGSAKPPTVYRALEFLEREGLAHRIESLSAYVACSGADQAHAAAFLLCDCCGRTEEIAAPVDEALRDLAARAGYSIETVAIEAHGRCAACRDPGQG
jgi:Fur family zinc uptake transcriptional regulator